MIDMANILIWAPLLMLTAARLAGMLLVAPVFGHQALPARLRIVLALAIALAVVGRLGVAPALPSSLASFALALAAEAAVGALIGYMARLVFAGVELGAFHVGAQLGVNLGDVFSAGGDEDETSAIGGAYGVLTLGIFLLIGGHRDLIRGLLDTFGAVPPAALSFHGEILTVVAGLLTGSFELALRVSAPVLIALLLATAALGLLQRTLPQAHILSTGLPARALVGLVMMAAGVSVVAWAFQAAWSRSSHLLPALLKTMT